MQVESTDSESWELLRLINYNWLQLVGPDLPSAFRGIAGPAWFSEPNGVACHHFSHLVLLILQSCKYLKPIITEQESYPIGFSSWISEEETVIGIAGI